LLMLLAIWRFLRGDVAARDALARAGISASEPAAPLEIAH
jgi:hypothetical protein